MRRAEAVGVRALRRALVVPARGFVLEIGAGTGLDFDHYDAHARVVATEPDLGMLERSRERVAGAKASIALVAADAEWLPFRQSVFDEAVVAFAMCTIPHPESAAAELRRTLRPGGVIRLLEHVRIDRPIIGRLQDWLTPVWRRLAGGCHLNRRPGDVLARSGFIIDSVEPRLSAYVQLIRGRADGDRTTG
jgi:ubiquinone/menaquinone biosynthesis C-methylase UbiE